MTEENGLPAAAEIDAEGNLLRSWGGPGEGYEWVGREHGIETDDKGNVWLTGNAVFGVTPFAAAADGRANRVIERVGHFAGLTDAEVEQVRKVFSTDYQRAGPDDQRTAGGNGDIAGHTHPRLSAAIDALRSGGGKLHPIEDAELGDVVEDRSAESPFEVAATALLPEEISRLLAPLDEREREILKLRFGLDRGEPRTLEEVGEHFNLTRERIRQIEARAMSKLRHPSSDTGARDLLAV